MTHAASREVNLNYEGAPVLPKRKSRAAAFDFEAPTGHYIDTKKELYPPFRIGPKPSEFIGPTGSDIARPLIEARLLDAARFLSYEQDPARRADERRRVRQQAYDAYMDGHLRLSREQYIGDAHESISHFVDLEIERHLGAIASGADPSLFAEQRDANIQMAGLLSTFEQKAAQLEREASGKAARLRGARAYLKNVLQGRELHLFDEFSGLAEIFKQEAARADGSVGPTGTKVLDTDPAFAQIVEQEDVGVAPTSGDIPVASSASAT